MLYSGFNGKRLGDIVKLVYTGSFSSDTDTAGAGAPYLRVFLEGDAHDVIFSPNTQPFPLVAEDVLHQWDVTEGTVRYDDDPGDGPDSPWQVIVAEHANEVISGILRHGGLLRRHEPGRVPANTCRQREGVPVGQLRRVTRVSEAVPPLRFRGGTAWAASV